MTKLRLSKGSLKRETISWHSVFCNYCWGEVKQSQALIEHFQHKTSSSLFLPQFHSKAIHTQNQEDNMARLFNRLLFGSVITRCENWELGLCSGQKKTQVACWLQDLLLQILPEEYKILAVHPQKGAGGICPSFLPWMQALCLKGHHKSFVIYDEPNCVRHSASWLVSVPYTLWPPFFSAYRDFYRWAVGWRAEDFPLGWPSQGIEEGEDRRLLFLEFCTSLTCFL